MKSLKTTSGKKWISPVVKTTKPTQIKAWPNQAGNLAAITPLFTRRKKTDMFNLDLSKINNITSSGLAILLIRLLKYLDDQDYSYRIIHSEKTASALTDLGFYRILEKAKAVHLAELFEGSTELGKQKNLSNLLYSSPLKYLEFSKEIDRRKIVRSFIKDFNNILSEKLNGYNFPKNGLLTVLNEIAKNSADHSGADSVFGFDIQKITQKSIKLTFSWGDLGPGIHEHFKKNLPPEHTQRVPYFDLTQTYRLALLMGNSSKSVKANRGLGLPTIIESSKCINLSLEVYDANSMGQLNEFSGIQKFSHAIVRKRFHDVGHEIGFFYYGEVIIFKNEN